MLTAAGLRTGFIFGNHEQTERKEALRDLASGKLQALIGSTILDVGVDVPALGMPWAWALSPAVAKPKSDIAKE
jgi:superfamily II DNA or RNA helicase